MNIIFDFDGTIADSLPVILPFANSTLKKFGKEPITIDELQTKGVKKIIESRNINKFAILIYILFSRHNLEDHIQEAKIFPEMAETIKKLSKNNNLGIITSSSKETVNKFVTKYKLADQFLFIDSSFGLFGKHKKINAAIKKYGFKRSETFYVGDETRDVEAAKASRVSSIGVTWGFEGPNLIIKAKSDKIARKPKDLLYRGWA